VWPSSADERHVLRIQHHFDVLTLEPVAAHEGLAESMQVATLKTEHPRRRRGKCAARGDRNWREPSQCNVNATVSADRQNIR
jgi:hypothetical protein